MQSMDQLFPRSHWLISFARNGIKVGPLYVMLLKESARGILREDSDKLFFQSKGRSEVSVPSRGRQRLGGLTGRFGSCGQPVRFYRECLSG